MKHIIIFTFQFNNQFWNWERTFYSDQLNLNSRVNNYLDQKILPFDLTTNIVKWKVKK